MDIPASLIAAVIIVESGGNCSAFRAEPHYAWLWDSRAKAPYRGDPFQIPVPPELAGKSTSATELYGQRISWGPMQVMGATSRELGFKGWFTELCTEEVGRRYGTLYLERLAGRHFRTHGWEGVIAAYNSGSPVIKSERVRRHVEKVMKHYRRLRAEGGEA